MLSRKIITAGIAFWLSVIVIVLIRPKNSEYGIESDEFWARKILWKNCFNIVLAGDSRILLGVSPEMMEKNLKDLKVGNFAFVALSYSDEYLEAVESKLLNKGEPRIIVLGISPRPLLCSIDTNCYFRKWDAKKKNPVDLYIARYTGWIKTIFRRITYEEMNFLGKEQDHLQLMISFPDGWMAARSSIELSPESLKTYKAFMKNRKIDSKKIGLLLRKTKEWSSKGIQVFGIMVPYHKKLYNFESLTPGWNSSSIKEDFERNGGKWLEFDQNEYFAYDFSHLRYDSAVQFSRDLAVAINENLNPILK